MTQLFTLSISFSFSASLIPQGHLPGLSRGCPTGDSTPFLLQKVTYLFFGCAVFSLLREDFLCGRAGATAVVVHRLLLARPPSAAEHGPRAVGLSRLLFGRAQALGPQPVPGA